MRKPLGPGWGTLVALTLVVGVLIGGGVGSPCVPRSFGYDSNVCVCNATYCDELPPVRAVAQGKAVVFTSSRAGLRMRREELDVVKEDRSTSNQVLTVKRLEKYQTVLGFGGAFTDAAGINVLSLPQEAQDRLLRSYFSEDGLEYNLGRVPIGGCDFSTREYTYADSSTADPKLTKFALQPDDYDFKIAMIHRAQAMMPASSGDLRLFGAIWSPPAWMKTSGKISGFGFLKKEYYQAYSDYFIKFLEAYDKNNVTLYAVSTGNEPLNGIFPFKNFNALGWWPITMHTWIKEHFGPTIRGSRFKDIKIVGCDDQRILLPWLLEEALSDKATTDYIDIIGYHWYLNFITPASILDKVHSTWPDKPIVNTEACNGDKPWDFHRVQLGSWTRGEYYLGDIVSVMNHWTTGWIDWNLALNTQGGPTWSKNWVDSPIIVDAEAGEFYRNPTFYALAHVAKFVPRGSVRIGLSSEGGPWFAGKVSYVAFQRPDNGITVVLINKHSGEHSVTIRDTERGDIVLDVPARSFVTTVYW